MTIATAGVRHVGPTSDPPPFTIGFEQLDDQVVLRVAGELDRTTIAEFEAAARSVNQRARVVVDMAAVAFVDSAGLRALLAAHDRFDEMVLRRPAPIVERLIGAAGVADRLAIEVPDAR